MSRFLVYHNLYSQNNHWALHGKALHILARSNAPHHITSHVQLFSYWLDLTGIPQSSSSLSSSTYCVLVGLDSHTHTHSNPQIKVTIAVVYTTFFHNGEIFSLYNTFFLGEKKLIWYFNVYHTALVKSNLYYRFISFSFIDFFFFFNMLFSQIKKKKLFPSRTCKKKKKKKATGTVG